MTAKDLLYKTLDYSSMWDHSRLNLTLPARLRLLQLETLTDAFGVSKKHINPLERITYRLAGRKETLQRDEYLKSLTNFEYFIRGEFLTDRPIEANRELIDRGNKKIEELFPAMPMKMTEKPFDIKWLFNNLLEFRKDVYRLTFPNEGMLEGFSSGLHYSFYLQGKFKKLIKENINEIDETLCLIIDPQKRSFVDPGKNYEDHNFEKIDLKWRLENY